MVTSKEALHQVVQHLCDHLYRLVQYYISMQRLNLHVLWVVPHTSPGHLEPGEEEVV